MDLLGFTLSVLETLVLKNQSKKWKLPISPFENVKYDIIVYLIERSRINIYIKKVQL